MEKLEFTEMISQLEEELSDNNLSDVRIEDNSSDMNDSFIAYFIFSDGNPMNERDYIRDMFDVFFEGKAIVNTMDSDEDSTILTVIYSEVLDFDE
jgi:hypothetical protein